MNGRYGFGDVMRYLNLHGALVQDVFGVYDSHLCIVELLRCIVEVKKGSGVTA